MDENRAAENAIQLAGSGFVWVTAKDLTWDRVFAKEGSILLKEGPKKFLLKKAAHHPSLWVAIGMYAGVTYKKVFGRDSEGEVETADSKQDPKPEPETSDKKAASTPLWRIWLASNGIKSLDAPQ